MGYDSSVVTIVMSAFYPSFISRNSDARLFNVKRMVHSGSIAVAIVALILLAALGPMHAQQPVAEATQVYALSSNISMELPTTWHAVKSDEIPSPGALAPYAPPFHFSQVATFTNEQKNSILLLGLSDNPLLGRDSYWLDTQMHAQRLGDERPGPSFLFLLSSITGLYGQRVTELYRRDHDSDIGRRPAALASYLCLSAFPDTLWFLFGASEFGDYL